MKNYKIKLIFIIFIALFANSLIMQAQNDCTVDSIYKVLVGVPGDAIPLPEIEVGFEGIGERPNYDDYRMLYFVHGLNGSSSAWANARTATTDGVYDAEGNEIFPAYKVETPIIDYFDVQHSLATASNGIRLNGLSVSNEFDPSYDNTDGIVIAHSQGGLVARQTDLYYSREVNLHERKFGGLVTVCTPNQGAQLLNNQHEEGMFLGMLNQLSEALSQGPVTENLNSNFFMYLLNTVFDLEGMVDGIANSLVNQIADYLIETETPAITQEYTVGAPKLNELNEYTPKTMRANGEIKHTDIVPFYAIRDTLTIDPLVSFERLVSFDESTDPITPIYETVTLPMVPVPISLATLQYFLSSPNDYPTFESQNGESDLAAKFHSTHLDYRAKVLEYSNTRHWTGLVNPIWGSADILARRKIYKAYKEGVEFMDKFDKLYRVTIGALYADVGDYNTSQCVCDAPHWLEPVITPLSPGQLCSDDLYQFDPEVTCEMQTITSPGLRWHHKDSDGVVLVESQMDIPQTTFGDPSILRLDGSTHMRVRNDENTSTLLFSVLRGDVGQFFETSEKDE